VIAEMGSDVIAMHHFGGVAVSDGSALLRGDNQEAMGYALLIFNLHRSGGSTGEK
jgi:hypothetical protein